MEKFVLCTNVIKAGMAKFFTGLLMLIIAVASRTLYAGGTPEALSMQRIMLEDSLKSSLPATARWEMSAVDVTAGKQMMSASSSPSAILLPGSLVKLFIAATVMERDREQSMSMVTTVAADSLILKERIQGNLYLKGSGNAFLSEQGLRESIDDLARSGILEISGDIIADDSLFEVRTSNNQWDGPAYSTPGSLGLDLHTVSLTVNGKSRAVKLEPVNEAVKVSFNPSGPTGIRQIDDLTYEVTGVSTDMKIIKKRFALKDPALYAAGTMKTLLEEKGIRIGGRVRKGMMPADAVILSRINSKSLADIVTDTNTNSVNVVADNLLLLLGVHKYGAPGTTEKGLRAVRKFLHDLGMTDDGIVLADGSGLSGDNRITAEYMAVFLQKITERSWFSTFYESLPRAGMDGTLRTLGYVNANVRAKTGHLDNVYALAGYVDRPASDRIAFSFIVNAPGLDAMGLGNTTGTMVVKYLAGDEGIGREVASGTRKN